MVLATEPYKSKNFPPQEIIMKNYDKIQNNTEAKISIVGKYQRHDNIYYIYYNFSSAGKVRLYHRPMILKRLDNNIWIIQTRYDRDPKILEK